MAVSFDDYRKVRINPAVTAAAVALSRAAEAAERDPRYAETVNRFGPERAHWLAVHYGSQALSESFQRHAPIELDPSKQAIARLDVFNWAASHMHGSTADQVQRRADSIWDRLSAIDKAKLAAAPGSSNTIIADALKGDPANAGRVHSVGAAADPAASGGQMINGRWVLGADAGIGRWLGIAGPDSGANSSGSRAYASIDPRVWSPDSGIGGLTPTNFGGSDFAKAGLTFNETQELSKKFGFDQTQIIHAGQDAKAIGLNPKDINTAKDFATVDRDDPEGRQQRNGAYSRYSKWLKEHKDELEKEQAAAEDTTATDEQRKLHAERVKKLMQEGQEQSGMKAVDGRVKDKPEAKAAHERIKHRIEKLNGVHAKEYDVSPKEAREKTDENLAVRKPDSHSTESHLKADLVAPKAPTRADADSILGEVSPKPEPKPADRKSIKVAALANGMGARV